MADTQRTRSALQTLFSDNVIGAISPQDLRDFLVTALQEEFVNANDFWCEPLAVNVDDLETRGWHWYSQEVSPDMSLSFGMIYALTGSNTWSTAYASSISRNRVLGVAADSYASGATTAQILRRGIVKDSTAAHVARLSNYVGYLVYLLSAVPGSHSITNDAGTDSRVVGYVVPNSAGTLEPYGCWYFCPDGWSVTGA